MAFGRRPVASFRERAVYKTEFDLFKRNTDIDLISLISYREDEADERHFDKKQLAERPKTVIGADIKRRSVLSRKEGAERLSIPYRPVSVSARQDERRQILRNSKVTPKKEKILVKSSELSTRQPYSRTKYETDLYKDFAKTSRNFLKQRNHNADHTRQCHSALDIRKKNLDTKADADIDRFRSQTTCGIRSTNINRSLGRYSQSAKSKVNTTSKQRETTFKPIVSKNLVTSVNKAWRLRTAAITGHCIPTDLTNTGKSSFVTGFNPKNANTDADSETDNCNRTRNSVSPLDNSENKLSSSVRSFLLEDDIESEYVTQRRENRLRVDDTLDSNKWEDRFKVSQECVVDDSDNGNNFEDIESLRASGTCDSEKDRCTKGDITCSKDSGFGSNAVTPEYLGQSGNTSVFKDNERHVKFFDSVNGQLDDKEDVKDLLDDVSSLDVTISEHSSDSDEETRPQATSVYGVTDLIKDLERFGNQSRLSVASSCLYNIDDETNSLFCDGDTTRPQTRATVATTIQEDYQESIEEITDQTEEVPEDSTMSKEARHAIIETLNDMGSKPNKRKKEYIQVELHKSVNAQKRMRENRSKYDHYMRERTRSVLRNQFKSLDSLGNDDESSRHSSQINGKDCEDSASDDIVRGKLFPSIRENTKLSRNTSQSYNNSQKNTKVYSLDQVKSKKYKIPGIGNYNLVTSPEDDFEITPPGFDSRYNPRPIISKEEMELPPRFIRERSIQKCKKWLDNVNMSPMSLKPVKPKKGDNS